LPWLGLFAKIAAADAFCSFDAVQLERKSFTARNYIKTHEGTQLLTVPTLSTGSLDLRICDVEIASGAWARKHIRAIELAYRKAPYFEPHFSEISAIIEQFAQGGMLADLNLDLMRYLMRAMGLQRRIIRACDYDFRGTKSLLVLDMCRQLGAKRYIFGAMGKDYCDREAFAEAGIAVSFQAYQHPVYPQLHGPFQPRMAVIDLLFNCGPDSLEILTKEDTRVPA